MRAVQREQWRANGTLLEPGPLVSQARKKRSQALGSGTLPRWQGQENGPPRWVVHRRPGQEGLSAEGWAAWETGQGCPCLHEKFSSSPRPWSSPPKALQEEVRKPAAQPYYRFRIPASPALSAAILPFLSHCRPGTLCRALFYICCSPCSHRHPVLREAELVGSWGLRAGQA